jgi:hypothetical protein
MPGNSAAAYATANILHSSSSTTSSSSPAAPPSLSILPKHAHALPQYGEYVVESPSVFSSPSVVIPEKEDYVFCDPVKLALPTHRFLHLSRD